jgi:hypothetical protein
MTVRQARDEDGVAIRRIIASTVLQAGFDPPNRVADGDLIDPAYYRQPGRGLWVAVDEDGEVVGCAALDRGDGGHAVLRRLGGERLDELLGAALAFAQGRGFTTIEAVVPDALVDARHAVEGAGFAPTDESNEMLYRRDVG